MHDKAHGGSGRGVGEWHVPTLPLFGSGGGGVVEMVVVESGLHCGLSELHYSPATHHLYDRDHIGLRPEQCLPRFPAEMH